VRQQRDPEADDSSEASNGIEGDDLCLFKTPPTGDPFHRESNRHFRIPHSNESFVWRGTAEAQ